MTPHTSYTETTLWTAIIGFKACCSRKLQDKPRCISVCVFIFYYFILFFNVSGPELFAFQFLWGGDRLLLLFTNYGHFSWGFFWRFHLKQREIITFKNQAAFPPLSLTLCFFVSVFTVSWGRVEERYGFQIQHGCGWGRLIACRQTCPVVRLQHIQRGLFLWIQAAQHTHTHTHAQAIVSFRQMPHAGMARY